MATQEPKDSITINEPDKNGSDTVPSSRVGIKEAMHERHGPGIAALPGQNEKSAATKVLKGRMTHGGQAIPVRTSQDGSGPAVIVTNRQSIERGMMICCPHAVVAIRDPGTPPARVVQRPNLLGILHLAFHDAHPITGAPLARQAVPMTPDHARAIWRFVQEHRQAAGAIVVHCRFGMCRSPAVAAAICQVLGGSPDRFFRECYPNMHVHRLVLEAAKVIEEAL